MTTELATAKKTTARPWKLSYLPGNPNPRIGNDKMLVTIISAGLDKAELAQANAELIVRAVNSFEELVSVAKQSLGSAKMMIEKTSGQMQLAWKQEAARLERALAKTEWKE